MERNALSHQCVNEETFTVGVKRFSRLRALISSLSVLEDVKNALEQINGGEE